MATEAQIEANRRNAQFSTGPRTEEGKAQSRLNAVTHGLCAVIPVLRDETLAEWQAFRDIYFQSFILENEAQICYAEQAALAVWRLKRIPRLEGRLVGLARRRDGEEIFLGGPKPLRSAVGEPPPAHPWNDDAMMWEAQTFVDSTGLVNISRYENHLHGVEKKSIDGLYALKRYAREEAKAFMASLPPAPSPIPEAKPQPEIPNGFGSELPNDTTAYDDLVKRYNVDYMETLLNEVREKALKRGITIPLNELKMQAVMMHLYQRRFGHRPQWYFG